MFLFKFEHLHNFKKTYHFILLIRTDYPLNSALNVTVMFDALSNSRDIVHIKYYTEMKIIKKSERIVSFKWETI